MPGLLHQLCTYLDLPIEVCITARSLHRRYLFLVSGNNSSLLPGLELACVLLASKVQEYPQPISRIIEAAAGAGTATCQPDEIVRTEMLVIAALGFDSLVGDRQDVDLLRVYTACAQPLPVAVQSAGWVHLTDAIWLEDADHSMESISLACLALGARDAAVDLPPGWYHHQHSTTTSTTEQEIEDAAWDIYRSTSSTS